MTLQETNLTVEGVNSVRDRPLTESYKVHDFGEAILKTRLQNHGYTVEDHGDDARHVDRIVFGDGPDLAVFDGGELVAYIEIKCKESQEWYGRCNRRHFNEYVNFSSEVDVPVFIWFSLVDTDEDVCLRDGFFQVESTDQIDGEVIEADSTFLVYQDDCEVVEIPNDDKPAYRIDTNDIVNISRGDQIVDSIPEVHGNEVVCLNENEIRSTAYILNQL